MSRPRYQEIPAAAIPVVRRPDGVTVRVVAGEAEGVRGPVTEIAAEPGYLDVTIPAGAEYVQAVPGGHAALAFVFEGDRVRAKAAGKKAVRFMLLPGKPLGEPIARYGPFVMNTKEEIEQAL